LHRMSRSSVSFPFIHILRVQTRLIEENCFKQILGF